MIQLSLNTTLFFILIKSLCLCASMANPDSVETRAFVPRRAARMTARFAAV